MRDFLLIILKAIFGSIWKLLSSIIIIVLIAAIIILVFGLTENVYQFLDFLKQIKI